MKKHIFYLIPIFTEPFLYLPVLLIFKLFCNFKVEGLENMEKLNGRVIIAANHASEWDPILIRAAFPLFTKFSPFYFVSAPKENFRSFGWKYFIYGGFLFEIFGAYSIRPGHHDYAYSLDSHLKILNKNRTLIIFPQGKRVAPGVEVKIHGGVAYLSHSTQSPVVPFHIQGTYRISLREFLLGTRHVTLTIKKALQPEEILDSTIPSVDDYKRGAELIFERVVV